MTLFTALLALAIGFVFLVIGGEALVRASISLAMRTKISPAVISLTIIAFGTSAPELFTSILAAFKGASDIAAGNVFGSNIFNVLAILGITFLLCPPAKPTHLMKFEWSVLLLATFGTYFFSRNLVINRWEGISFLTLLAASLFLSIRNARRQGFEADDDEPLETLKTVYLDFAYLVIGLIALIGGAQLALHGGTFIGEWAGLSEKIIGVTIISVGTGLPELATSAVAAYRGRSDIAIGNVLGSNLMNTLAVLGGTAALTPLSISSGFLSVDIWVFLLTTLLLLPIVLGTRFFLSRTCGALMLLVYGAYVFKSLTA